MSDNITKIEVTIWTAAGTNTGTNDNVFFGLGGREFRLKTENPNFAAGEKDVFILGNNHNVEKSDWNDPGKPQLTTNNLYNFPVYIRKAGTLQGDDDDAWKVERVDVDVNDSAYSYKCLKGSEDIWLSNETGLILFLR